jgi:hypothetical protein
MEIDLLLPKEGFIRLTDELCGMFFWLLKCYLRSPMDDLTLRSTVVLLYFSTTYYAKFFLTD